MVEKKKVASAAAAAVAKNQESRSDKRPRSEKNGKKWKKKRYLIDQQLQLRVDCTTLATHTLRGRSYS